MKFKGLKSFGAGGILDGEHCLGDILVQIDMDPCEIGILRICSPTVKVASPGKTTTRVF